MVMLVGSKSLGPAKWMVEHEVKIPWVEHAKPEGFQLPNTLAHPRAKWNMTRAPGGSGRTFSGVWFVGHIFKKENQRNDGRSVDAPESPSNQFIKDGIASSKIENGHPPNGVGLRKKHGIGIGLQYSCWQPSMTFLVPTPNVNASQRSSAEGGGPRLLSFLIGL